MEGRVALNLVTRLNKHIREDIEEQDHVKPQTENLSYNVMINSIDSSPDENYFNFGFTDGTKTTQSFASKKVQTKSFDPNEVRYASLGFYTNFVLRAIVLKDENKNIIYESSRNLADAAKQTEIVLEKDERIIGFKGR